MKYLDAFKQPVSKDDVAMATRIIVRTGRASSTALQRHMKIGYGKAATILGLLEDAKVISGMSGTQPRVVLLQREEIAVNAALRQLNKDKRGK